MTPATTLVRIEELRRRDMTQAWLIAGLYRSKKFPSSPEELWGGKSEQAEMSDQMLVKVAQAIERGLNTEKRRGRAKRPRPILRDG